MVQKRPFYDKELYNTSSKYQRQVECDNQLVSFSEFVPPEVNSSRNHTLGECVLTVNATEGRERHASDLVARFQVGEKGVETIVLRRSLNSSPATSIGMSEGTSDRGTPVYLPCPQEYFSPEHSLRTVSHHHDIYSLLLRYPPQKAVPIGSNYQAEIPEWNPQDIKTNLKSSSTPEMILDANLVFREEAENRLMGTCVIPMPDSEHTDEVGNVKNDCRCLDEGSIRCVQQHIVEARQKVKRNLGMKRFEELGFCDMGEQVSEKWSEEEEQLFHEVLFSYPVSLGKNFWNRLSTVFPSRTKRDIVCYYFNVFMLQRRAEQNRCKSMCLYDSDNDEWHESDAYDDEKPVMAEEGEDSDVESPVHKDKWVHIQSQKRDAYVQYEGAEDDISDDYDNSDFACDGDIPNFSVTCPRMSFDKSGSNPKSCILDEMLDQEVHDESCISNTGVSSQGIHVKAESGDNWPYSFNGVGCGTDEYHVLEPCAYKVSDAGYMIGPKHRVDFLPTCSMIEEVFGDGSWKYKARDDKSVN